ncbi:uncharacterized protein LOC143300497 [Babylonia areolata]|uniref:uncharacterized protein LOC143300497 n=1 Tax=Babylonia areolata TaxID=304850 RepID=UPI003FD12B8C
MQLKLVIFFVSVVSLCSGQEPDLEVSILNSTRWMETAGSAMNLTCRLNRGLTIILSHTVDWIHVSLANPQKLRETTLTTLQTLTDHASPNLYGIGVKYDQSQCEFTLQIKNVQPTSDGIFKCRVSKTSGGESMEKEAHVIVVNDVEKVAMMFDGEESITEEADSVTIQREEGTYGVTCTALGFNPDASISIFLDDVEQETGGTQIVQDLPESLKANARRYKAEATASNVDVRAQHTGKRLKCVAKAGFEGATAVSASVPLMVIALEPVITCDKNVSAKVGDLYVKIKCRVDHKNIQIERYRWEIEESGEMVVQEETSKNYHEVIVEEVDSDTTFVTLDLYQVTDLYFNTIYNLDVFTTSGQSFRQTATIIKLDSPPSGSSPRMAAVVWVCVLSAWLSLWSWC